MKALVTEAAEESRVEQQNPPSFQRSWMKLLDELLSRAVTLSLRGSMFLVSHSAAL